MTASEHKKEKFTLCHPSDMQPEDWLRFVLLPGFEKGWKRLRLTDEDLQALQMAIMAAPEGAPIVPQTGGLRKLRFAPGRWNVGKSGAARVCYAYFANVSVVVLVRVYAKKDKADLSAAERASIKQELERIREILGKEEDEEGTSDV